jgi:hypothetical protein
MQAAKQIHVHLSQKCELKMNSIPPITENEQIVV